MVYLPFEDMGYLLNISPPRSEGLWAVPKKLVLIHASVGLVDLGLAWLNFCNSILECVFSCMKTQPFMLKLPSRQRTKLTTLEVQLNVELQRRGCMVYSSIYVLKKDADLGYLLSLKHQVLFHPVSQLVHQTYQLGLA